MKLINQESVESKNERAFASFMKDFVEYSVADSIRVEFVQLTSVREKFGDLLPSELHFEFEWDPYRPNVENAVRGCYFSICCRGKRLVSCPFEPTDFFDYCFGKKTRFEGKFRQESSYAYFNPGKFIYYE